ncbi:MAG: hypothetical protein VXW65_14565 [Pseudomonadota bacterium]|nr:hypothetical protein [Pseudomonadota bacterium]
MTSIKKAIVLALAYTATRTIRHNGERYQDGDLINLDDRFAKPLLECGAVVVDAKALAARAALDNQADLEQQALEAERRAKAEADALAKAEAERAEREAQQAKAEGQSEQHTESKTLSDLTVPELKALATERKIDFPSRATRADLIALLGG